MWFMEKGIVLVLVICWLNSGFGQDDNKPVNKYVSTKNNFSIGYSLGLNKTRFFLEQGVDVPDAPPGLINELNFTYTFRLKHDFDLSIRGGLGFYPFAYGFGEKNDPNALNFLSYSDRMQYSNYLNLTPILNYNYWFKKKWLFSAGVGAGLRIHANEGAYALGQFGPNWWAFYYDYGTRPKVYSLLGVGAKRLLKNQDMIGLDLSYNHGFGETFEGVYELNINNVISRGSILNSGNYFQATLTYTFTRAKKWDYIERHFQEENTSFNDGKKEFKKERRFIDPKSIFIGVAAGGTYLQNALGDDPFIESSYHMAGKAAFLAEIGTQSNKFFELGLSSAGYSSGYKITGNSFNVNSSSNIVQAYELRMGYGLRLINKNSGFNYFDISGGLQLGFHTLTNDDLFFYNQFNNHIYESIPDGEIIIDLETTESVKHNFFPLLYMKAGKNFRITNWLYFSAEAQYNVGFYPITTKEISYTAYDDPIVQNDVEIKLNGTGLQFLFGIKYKFTPRDK